MDEDTIPCSSCDGIMDECNEGYYCDNCGMICNLCNDCRKPMKLLNFCWNWKDINQYNNFSATYPPENVGKEFKSLKDDGDDFYYIDDQTRFYWRCEECDLEETTECD